MILPGTNKKFDSFVDGMNNISKQFGGISYSHEGAEPHYQRRCEHCGTDDKGGVDEFEYLRGQVAALTSEVKAVMRRASEDNVAHANAHRGSK